MRKLLRTDLRTKEKYVKIKIRRGGSKSFLKVGHGAEFQVAAQEDEACRQTLGQKRRPRAPSGRGSGRAASEGTRRAQASRKGRRSQKLLEKKKLLKTDHGSLFIKLVMKS